MFFSVLWKGRMEEVPSVLLSFFFFLNIWKQKWQKSLLADKKDKK